jgi:hypothetical protein
MPRKKRILEKRPVTWRDIDDFMNLKVKIAPNRTKPKESITDQIMKSSGYKEPTVSVRPKYERIVSFRDFSLFRDLNEVSQRNSQMPPKLNPGESSA